MEATEREFMERQIDLAMAGRPEHEVPGDEDTEPQKPLLESFPHQKELKKHLQQKGYIEFWGSVQMKSKLGKPAKSFNVLGARGNLAWCCDPDCDRVIVDMPITMFINGGTRGEISQHQGCFERNLNAGYYELPRIPATAP